LFGLTDFKAENTKGSIVIEYNLKFAKKLQEELMARFHSLKIKDIKKETSDCVSITFDIPEDLKPEFAYNQGQYLTLKLNVGGEELRRSYSICFSPATDEDLRIAVKKVEDGRASGYLNNGITPGTA